MLYSTFPEELTRDVLRDVETARARTRGLWARGVDRTLRWSRLRRRPDLVPHALWPKLFRRLYDFLGLGESLAKLDEWMRVDPENRDDRVVVARSTKARLHDLVDIHADRLRLRCDPLEIVILSRAAVIPVAAPRGSRRSPDLHRSQVAR
jgi:hypothetical protein